MTRQPRPDQPAYDEGYEAGIRFAHESMATKVRAALDGLIRSVEGRCSDPRCPSRHEGAGPDCLDAAVARARAALAKTPDPATQANLGVCPVCQNLFRQDGHSFDCPLAKESHSTQTPDPATGRDARATIERQARLQDALDALMQATLWVHRTTDMPREPKSWDSKARSGIVGLRAALAREAPE